MLRKIFLRPILWVVLSTGLCFSCDSDSVSSIPKQTEDGWPTASLKSVGMNEEPLSELVASIENKTYQNIHSVLIIKDGKLVFERYFSGYAWAYNAQFRGEYVSWDRDTIHNLASVTKSFTSTLIGIAIDEGLMQSIADHVSIYFTEYRGLFDNGKEKLILEHLLTMRAGLEWNEGELPYSNPNNDLVRLFSVDDPVSYILSKPLVHEPGTAFYYSGGCTNLLGEAIRSVSGKRLDAFAREYLFEPLGIIDYQWDFINPDFIHASGNLKLRPRDMAKLGYLFLNEGRWNGLQIVSEEWVEAATNRQVPFSWGGYGYQWWVWNFRIGSVDYTLFYAAGWGGQKIYIFRDLDMVVVLTGGNYTSEDPTNEIITNYILSAL